MQRGLREAGENSQQARRSARAWASYNLSWCRRVDEGEHLRPVTRVSARGNCEQYDQFDAKVSAGAARGARREGAMAQAPISPQPPAMQTRSCGSTRSVCVCEQ
eukprot:6188909-Pleurochrysis_carterae.AAC.4